MQGRTVADGLDLAAVEPRQTEQNQHRAAHGDHAEQFVGHGTQHGVERGEVPDRLDVGRGHHRIGRNEVVVFQEQAAEGRREEQDERGDGQEEADAEQILDGVVRVERNAVFRLAVLVLHFLDVDAFRIVRADFVQGAEVQDDQQQDDQRQRDHVQGEETVQGGVGNEIVTADPLGQFRPDDRHRTEQIDDHLRAPIGHLAPGQHVTEEGFRHQGQEDQHAEDPDQFARFLIRTVDQAAEHVQIHHHEEQRGAGGVHVADQPAAFDIAHDVFDRGEGFRRARFEVHGQEDAGDDLIDQDQHGQRTEVVEQIEVLRCVVFRHVFFVGRHQSRRALIEPRGDAGDGTFDDAHQTAPSGATPITMVLSSE